MTAKRPTGVTILAILEAISGVLTLLGACALIGLGGVAAGAGAAAADTSAEAATAAGMGILGIVLGVISLVLGLASIIVAFGLWTLKGWAWMIALVLSILSVVMAIVELLRNSSGGVASVLFSVVISGIVIFYLLQPSVKQAFGRK